MSESIQPNDAAPLDTSRLALVIGNSAYPDADFPLPQITSDAEALTNSLREDGFLVDAIENTTRLGMTRAIDHLKNRLRSNSTVLVYFGGYGIQSDGQNYLIPIDATIWSEEDVRRQGVSLDRLLLQLRDSGARVRLAVIEASRRNPYERRFRTYSHGLAPIRLPVNALVLSSAGPSEVVEDSEGLHSQLISALLVQMETSREIEEVFSNTRNAVVAATRGQQIPVVLSTLTESFHLSRAQIGAPAYSVGSAISGHR
ncbi:caspase family protein [Bradyrhizobium sp. CCBAU 51627]|uniref:caspase family protein n=1 Tax=Bradyrhizobium sp. CCBAU 51627 TaxID=1325088 RepID=UPI002305D00C|nr:caspase family protein [Bradyrhizobium sp. CCBAU 51627]